MGFYNPNSLVQDGQRHGVVVLPPDINVSWHDCTVEAHETDPTDVVTYLGQSWRRGRGHVDDPIRPAVAVRLGLRYVRNLGEREVTRIEAARILGGPFSTAEDLASRGSRR
jgi:error-prone DNA polymerase